MAKILIVDDDYDLCKVMEEFLIEQGHDVIMAHDGKKGLNLAEREEVDLILLDVQMPVMDGFTFLSEIRNRPHLNYIPILMLTTISGEEFQVAGLRKGADDYVTKPFSLDILDARISSLLRRTEKKTQSKRLQYNLLFYLTKHYEKQNYQIYTRLLPKYKPHPQDWEGHVPDLIIHKGGKFRLFFLESLLTMNAEDTVSRWKSTVKNYPYAEVNIVVRDDESFNLAKRLIKTYSLKVNIRLMKRKKSKD